MNSSCCYGEHIKHNELPLNLVWAVRSFVCGHNSWPSVLIGMCENWCLVGVISCSSTAGTASYEIKTS